MEQDNNALLEMLLDMHDKVSETNTTVAVIKANQERDQQSIAKLKKDVIRLDRQAGYAKGAILFIGVSGSILGLLKYFS